MFGLLFVRLCINFLQKMYYATYWAIFSQTHLVTLTLRDFNSLEDPTRLGDL
jgi:hypothetical protein